MEDCRTPAPDEAGRRRARFLDDATGLLAVEVTAPVPVALALVDALSRIGVSMTAYEVGTHGDWARQRISLTERDGTRVRSERRLRLQAEVMTLLGEGP